MKCHICGKPPSDGTNLFRQNAKGQVGVWACAPHSKPVDDELVRIVANIQHNWKRANGITGEAQG
jgi:hypothetical protein